MLNVSEISSNITNHGKLYVAIDVSEAVNIEFTKNLVKTIVEEINRPTRVIFTDTKVIKSVDYDEFNKTLFILGKGNTDLEPAFSYVDELLNENGCCGLIYITSGYGFFPENEPSYPVTWVLTGGSPNEDTPFGKNVLLN